MNILNILQIIVSVLLVVVIIFQTRGTEAGITFGGGGQSYRSKKGLEKVLFYATIVLAAIFAFLSIISVLI
ncbi:MAG TPA: preprotein translocase subunit SecG [Patescibacteria group bacterium]|nr:preprotein translocase subunit SecG [Patescibacteria group bacterium]